MFKIYLQSDTYLLVYPDFKILYHENIFAIIENEKEKAKLGIGIFYTDDFTYEDQPPVA